MELDLKFYKSLLDNLHDGVYFVDVHKRITYWNKAAETITGYSASEVVGRRCSDNILNHVDDQGRRLCESGCPLADTMSNRVPRSIDVYLLHKEGHRIPVFIRSSPIPGTVPVQVHASPILDQKGKPVGAVEIFGDNSDKVAALEKIQDLEKMVYVDPLTGLANRHYAEIRLQARFHELHRYNWPFGIIFTDIDQFKSINDTYGHEVGDRVLIMVGKTLANSVRSFDLISRWGGEEFVGIIANVNEGQLYAVADKLRLLVEQSGFHLGAETIRVTISGGAALAQPTDTPESLLERADRLMYYSKSAGRNRISLRLN